MFYIIIIVFTYSCDFGLRQEVNKEQAVNFINKDIKNFSEVQLKKCNAEQVIYNNGNYLFVANSFNGDFNGYVYTKDLTVLLDTMKFNNFYFTHHDSTIGNWTKVYGKW